MGIPPNEYFDLGSWQTWNFMNWQNGTVDMKALDQWLDSYVSQAKAGGVREMTLSFAQICDLSSIIAGKYVGSPDDALKILSQNTNGNGAAFLQHMLQRLNADGMKVELSFGGATATAADWNFGFVGNNTPQSMAQNLANWAHQMGFSGIDFDFEAGSATMISENGASNIAQFFASLHQDLQAYGITSTMTVMGDASQWGITSSTSYLSQMFTQGHNFAQMFDGLNLMLYNGQYYLNVGQQPLQSWDLTVWISQLQQNTGLSAGQCAQFLHIGFDGGVDYTKTSSSGGPLPYNPPLPSGLSNGQAAAWIYQQLIQELRTHYNDPSLLLGSPFFWDDHANYTVDHNNPVSQFFNNNTFDLDFLKYLSQNRMI